MEMEQERMANEIDLEQAAIAEAARQADGQGSSTGGFSPWAPLRAVFGIALAGVLIWLTVHRTGTDLRASLRSLDLVLIALAVGVYGLALLISMWRWQLLLHVQGIRVPFRHVARLTLTGFFFNMLVPGATGGDVVKMAFLARVTEGKRTEALFSVVVDRVIGMIGLFFVAAVAVLISLPFLLALPAEHQAAKLAALTVGAGSVGAVIGMAAVEWHNEFLRIPHVQALLDWLSPRVPHRLVDAVVRLTRALDGFRRARGSVFACLGLSMLMHSLLAVDLFLVGRALGERVLGLRGYVVTAQVANAVAGIPLTPAGVGTRDMVTSEFFKAFGTQPEAAGAIAVVLTFCMLFWALVGAGVFAFGSHGKISE